MPPPAALPDKLPEASKASREEVRFNRYDCNRDELISRLEMMGILTEAFKSPHKVGNSVLAF
jgi:hypothetical protein